MRLSLDFDESDRPQTSGRHSGRSFYAAPVSEFRITDDDAIIGRLSSRHVAFHAAAEAEQLRAWEREIEILKESFAKLGSLCDDWQLLLEIPLLRLGKRIDAVVLAPGIVGVIEFKINATGFQSADRVQTERYAQSLSDFHEASQQRLILPILCAERARARPPATTLVEGVGTLMEANATTLADAFLVLQSHVDANAAAIDAHGFDYSPYRPTPNIVEAAQALYAGHEIADIGRGDAADAELQAAAAALQEIAADAEAGRTFRVPACSPRAASAVSRFDGSHLCTCQTPSGRIGTPFMLSGWRAFWMATSRTRRPWPPEWTPRQP